MSARKKLLTISLAALFAAAIAVPTVFAIFSKQKQSPTDPGVNGSFTVSLSAYYENTDGTTEAAVVNNDVIAVDLTKINSLRLDLTLKTAANAHLRVQLLHYWTETIEGHTYYPAYACPLYFPWSSRVDDSNPENTYSGWGTDKWIDNLSADNSFYYRGVVAAGTDLSLKLVDGVTPDNTAAVYGENTALFLYIKAEIAQSNRAAAIWPHFPKDEVLAPAPTPAPAASPTAAPVRYRLGD